MFIHLSRLMRRRGSGIRPSRLSAPDEIPELFDRRGGGVERPGNLAGEEHEDAVAVTQELVQVAGREDDRASLVAALLQLGPQVDDRLDIQPAGGVLEQHDLGARPDEGEQRPLLVAAGERLHGTGRGALDVVLGDALLRQSPAAAPGR